VWAVGNAWTAIIIETDGKYHSYFSGHNTVYNHKSDGVAITDDTEGPFTAEPETMITNMEAVEFGQAIDPTTFKDSVSGKFFCWRSGKPLMAELNDAMVSTNWNTAKNIEGFENFWEDLFINYRKSIYHPTYSIDNTGSSNYVSGTPHHRYIS
jgi:large repetitive protein